MLFEHGFWLKILEMRPHVYVWQSMKSVAARTAQYVDVFVRENFARVMTLWRRYDVRKFNADTISVGTRSEGV